ncbi:venom allergen [Roseibium sp. TrichSKD4]|nr:venom allergen [Roseibium sp. TrichSKD4]
MSACKTGRVNLPNQIHVVQCHLHGEFGRQRLHGNIAGQKPEVNMADVVVRRGLHKLVHQVGANALSSPSSLHT